MLGWWERVGMTINAEHATRNQHIVMFMLGLTAAKGPSTKRDHGSAWAGCSGACCSTQGAGTSAARRRSATANRAAWRHSLAPLQSWGDLRRRRLRATSPPAHPQPPRLDLGHLDPATAVQPNCCRGGTRSQHRSAVRVAGSRARDVYLPGATTWPREPSSRHFFLLPDYNGDLRQ
jgi:hypothetical protein